MLRNENFQTVTLQELYDYMKNGTALPEKSIVLTFDDGYLDNWVYAYPLLKKYGFKGTIYVNPEFADSRDIVRKNLEDIWYHGHSFNELETTGFLSWEEMRIMEREGIMDIQAHSMSHTWYYCEDEIVDFHCPGNRKYPWLFWNANPRRKSYYLSENQETYVPYGTPVYKSGRSLGIRRYFQDMELDEYIVKYAEKEGIEFFKRKDWKDILFKEAESYRFCKKSNGRYETDSEQDERYRYELIECKKLLEERLKKEVKFLCWAGGALNDKALKIAYEAGYISTTRYFDEPGKKNETDEDPSAINRISCESAFFLNNKFISFSEPEMLFSRIRYFQGSGIHLWIMRIYKIKYLANFFARRLFKGGTTN